MKKNYKLLALLLTLLSTSAFSQNRVLSFDGTNDFVDLGSTVATGARTIELWFNPGVNINSNLSSFKTLIARDIGSTNAQEFNIAFMPSSIGSAVAGKLRFGQYDNSANLQAVYSNNNTWNRNQWYHVAAVIDPNQGMMLFIDGVKQATINSFSSAIPMNSSSTLVASWGNVSSRFFNGSIDDLRISDSALYDANFTPDCSYLKPTANTKGVWNFNNTSFSSIAVDSSSNQNNGIINGALKTIDDICTVTSFGNCLYFDGASDHVNLGSSVMTGARTIEMWFQPRVNINATLAHLEPLISRENFPSASQSDELLLTFQPSFLSNSGALRFVVSSPGGVFYSIFSDSSQWNMNQWYHVAAVIHPLQGLIMFIDGVKQNSTATYIFPPNASSTPTLIGTQANISTRYFNGRIDDVRLSDSAIYSANFTPPCTDVQATRNTIGVWNFNDSSNVSITIDSSGNNNNGLIMGATGVTDTICPIVITSIKTQTDTKDKLLVYPNPFQNSLTFDFGKNEGANAQHRVQLYSLDGRLLLEKSGNSKLILETQSLPQGMYFYLVFQDGKVINSNKLVKN